VARVNDRRDKQINARVRLGNNACRLANVIQRTWTGAKKGGNAPIMKVYRYGHSAMRYGLVFMNTPGCNRVSATVQIAGGANLMGFTTGCASYVGSMPAPTIKPADTSRCDDSADGPTHLRTVAASRLGRTDKKRSSFSVGENELVLEWKAALLT
jgi:altronate dehydratase